MFCCLSRIQSIASFVSMQPVGRFFDWEREDGGREKWGGGGGALSRNEQTTSLELFLLS